MDKNLSVMRHFRIDGTPVSCTPVGKGLVNKTFLVTTNTGRKYTLQTINKNVFPNIPALMKNVISVTEFLAARTDDPRGTIHFVPRRDGKYLQVDSEGNYRRVYEFIDNCLCLQAPETPEDFFESAVAFGRFQYLLRDFPAETLTETIPNFHNTPDRYRLLRSAISSNLSNRLDSAYDEIQFALDHESLCSLLQEKRESGVLPVRVTHNDTKLNNVMLDATTRKALCVIDLDTVMPGLAAYDFGDSIRFGAATAAEDEPDTSKMSFDLSLYETYARGFLSACPGLSNEELESLPLGALTITIELGVRFLTDYLNGDIYFKTSYPEHNLVRARAQFKLASDMEAKFDEMNRIIKEI